jgi:hypothetical protein
VSPALLDAGDVWTMWVHVGTGDMGAAQNLSTWAVRNRADVVCRKQHPDASLTVLHYTLFHKPRSITVIECTESNVLVKERWLEHWTAVP